MDRERSTSGGAPAQAPAKGETRVSHATELTALLHDHLGTRTGPDGLLFRGIRGGPSRRAVYGTMGRARDAAFSAEEYASPLARRPYGLRHAAVSTWLNGGVPATPGAEWAGHSVDVLLRVYAKCIAGQGGPPSHRSGPRRLGGLKLGHVLGTATWRLRLSAEHNRTGIDQAGERCRSSEQVNGGAPEVSNPHWDPHRGLPLPVLGYGGGGASVGTAAPPSGRSTDRRFGASAA